MDMLSKLQIFIQQLLINTISFIHTVVQIAINNPIFRYHQISDIICLKKLKILYTFAAP